MGTAKGTCVPQQGPQIEQQENEYIEYMCQIVSTSCLSLSLVSPEIFLNKIFLNKSIFFFSLSAYSHDLYDLNLLRRLELKVFLKILKSFKVIA